MTSETPVMKRVMLNDPEIALELALALMNQVPPVLLLTTHQDHGKGNHPAEFREDTMRDLKLSVQCVHDRAVALTLAAAGRAGVGCALTVFTDHVMPEVERDRMACLTLHRSAVPVSVLVDCLAGWLTSMFGLGYTYFFIWVTPTHEAAGEGGAGTRV